MDPPAGSFACLFTEACAVRDAQGPSVPAGRSAGRDRQLADNGFQQGPGVMKALDRPVFGRRGDTPFAGPDGHLLHRIPAGTPGQRQPHQVRAGPHAARALERLGFAGQTFEVHMGREPRQKSGETINRPGRRV